ncbi:type IV toxin-antitoxin system AbiEi family antitoxin domain-containing protein [Aminipila sp.]|uniref:type IV toxin-antitoxin system AbiEi family antitoxin domain-containing protein n=1 Tax=Aminipila sp. TaxID=2060095 RepID=UPI00289ED79F|nr:AbiEi antitoxin N-terminal domain-containing protein [Aminipila sp.]
MASTEFIMEMIKKNNGVITAAEVTKAGISRGNLKYKVDTGLLERTGRGVYQLSGSWEDEIYNLQVRYKRGIFSGTTALYLFDLTDGMPAKFQMTFPHNYNISTVKGQNVKCNRVIMDLYELGVVEVKTSAGNTVRAYNMERTLCDILRKHNKTDIQITADAFKRYVRRKDKNITMICEYGKKLKVEEKLQTYLEVLL